MTEVEPVVFKLVVPFLEMYLSLSEPLNIELYVTWEMKWQLVPSSD